MYASSLEREQTLELGRLGNLNCHWWLCGLEKKLFLLFSFVNWKYQHLPCWTHGDVWQVLGTSLLDRCLRRVMGDYKQLIVESPGHHMVWGREEITDRRRKFVLPLSPWTFADLRAPLGRRQCVRLLFATPGGWCCFWLPHLDFSESGGDLWRKKARYPVSVSSFHSLPVMLLRSLWARAEEGGEVSVFGWRLCICWGLTLLLQH